MKIELFLDEGEEYPQLFSVWRVDQETGRADLTTRKNYVDDSEGWDHWRKTDNENITLKADNAKLRELVRELYDSIDSVFWDGEYATRERLKPLLHELGIEVEVSE